MLYRQGLAGSNILTVRSHNLSAVLLGLLLHQPISRVRLAELTGLSRTTISNLIGALLKQGVVVEDGPTEHDDHRGVGRRRTALRLVPSSRHAAAVHIDVGLVRVAVSDLHANLKAVHSLAHPLSALAEEVLAQAAGLLERALVESGADPGSVVGVGVGASGLVDPASGVNLLAPNLGWRDVPIGNWLTKRLGLPVCVDNNVRAMALGEALFGAGHQVHTLAFVYARIGVLSRFLRPRELTTPSPRPCSGRALATWGLPWPTWSTSLALT